LATTVYHMQYLGYDSELVMVLQVHVGYMASTLAMRSNDDGTIWMRATAGTNENEGLWLVNYEWKATYGTQGTAGYTSTQTRLNRVVHGFSTAEYRVTWNFVLEP